MFTGIVKGEGEILSIVDDQEARKIEVDGRVYSGEHFEVGESVAVNGVCLTITSFLSNKFIFDISPETQRVVKNFIKGQKVNLERALTLSDKLGGHLVTGHVDEVGKVQSVIEGSKNYTVTVSHSVELSKFIARKGSIAIDGVSLTVNVISKDTFSVNLIPHTWNLTALKELEVGALVNLEIDLIARYVERMLG